MRLSRRALFLAVLFTCSAALFGQNLLVLSKQDQTLAVVDPATLQVVAKVPVGNDPHEVIASTDGRTAYISNYGFGAFHTLAVVDLVAHKPLPPVDLGALRGPHGLAFVDGKVWFTAEAAKSFGRYDPATQNIDLIIGTGQDRTHMIWVSPDSQTIVTTNVTSATVSVFAQQALPAPGPPPGMSPSAGTILAARPQAPPPGAAPQQRTDWHQTIIPVGRGSEGLDVSPDDKQIWTANAQDGTLSVIDLSTKAVIESIAASVPGANRLKFTPDGKLFLVSSGPSLAIFDAHTRREIKRIGIGRGTAGILIQPDGARAFISCGPDNYVAVIDLHSLTVTGHIDAGPEPDGLAWASAH